MSILDKYLAELQDIQKMNADCERKYKSLKNPNNPYASELMIIHCKLERIHKIRKKYEDLYEQAINECVKEIRSGKMSAKKIFLNDIGLKKVCHKKPEIQKVYNKIGSTIIEWTKLRKESKEYRAKYDKWKNSKNK
jgi:hypothetical protein